MKRLLRLLPISLLVFSCKTDVRQKNSSGVPTGSDAGMQTNADGGQGPTTTATTTYSPNILDFGRVAVNTEKTLNLSVNAIGLSTLNITSVTRIPDNEDTAALFTYTLSEEIMNGLPPGQSAVIAVTYRPCPDAWTNDGINEEYDFSNCPHTAHQVKLAIVDNTEEGGAEIVMTEQPVQAPVFEVWCPRGGNNCGIQDPLFSECINFAFGSVASGETPCDIEFEIRNRKRNGKLTSDLLIDRIEMLASEITGIDTRLRNGDEIGFSVIDTQGTKLDLSAGPLVVSIPDTAAEYGAVRLRARFTGAELGAWRGEGRNGGGMRFYSNSPNPKDPLLPRNQPVKAVSFSGSGSAPSIQVWPPILQFGPVPQGATRTATLTVSNAGDADLTISNINFQTDTIGAKFTYQTSLGNPPFVIPPFSNNRFEIIVSYTPDTSGQDADVLIIESDDLNDNPFEVAITGGALPRIAVDPSDTLVFALPNPQPPPPIPPRTESFRVSNIGYGDLTISQLAITGPGADPQHPSADDFVVTECNGQNPCNPNIVLCSSSQTGCVNSEATFNVVFSNNDNSPTDLAELRITSNDPTKPEHILVLSAQDVPCLFPTPQITVVSTTLQVGTTVDVNALTSDPGGAPGTPATLTDYQWQWLFTPGAAPPFDSQGTVATSFTPTTAGTYILGLHVVNDCGSMSQTAANETLSISP